MVEAHRVLPLNSPDSICGKLSLKQYKMDETRKLKMKSTLAASIGSSGRKSDEDDDASKKAITMYRMKEEEIEKRKMEMRKRVEMQLLKAEEEAKRLTQVWEELDGFPDPTRKELTIVRRKLEHASKDLKSLAQICQKKEKEYKEAMETFQERSKEKAHLTSALMELLNKSEVLRMRKLEELSKVLISKP